MPGRTNEFSDLQSNSSVSRHRPPEWGTYQVAYCWGNVIHCYKKRESGEIKSLTRFGVSRRGYSSSLGLLFLKSLIASIMLSASVISGNASPNMKNKGESSCCTNVFTDCWSSLVTHLLDHHLFRPRVQSWPCHQQCTKHDACTD